MLGFSGASCPVHNNGAKPISAMCADICENMAIASLKRLALLGPFTW